MKKLTITTAALLALTATAVAQTYQPPQRALGYQNYPPYGSPYAGPDATPPGSSVPPGGGGS